MWNEKQFNEIQKYKKNSYRFEIDSSPEVYELYEKIYPEEIKKEYDISYPKFFKYRGRTGYGDYYINEPEQDNRLFALPYGTFSKESKSNGVKRLSGDCYFNFNSKKIEELDKIRGIDKEKLEKCENMHYSIYNMVLLQSVGNMQRRKQQGLKLSNDKNKYENLDRGDTFLYLLNEYYKNKNEEILAESTKANKGVLREYLESFKDIYEYADKMLHIKDKYLIKKMLENGQHPLSDQDRANKYLDIALEFWEKRKTEIDPLIKER